MTLIHYENLLCNSHFNVILLINNVSEDNFINFIKAIIQKQSWPENLCSCDFYINGSDEFYLFESDDYEEGELLLPYTDVLYYVKYAAAKYKEVYATHEEMVKIDALEKEIELITK